MKFRKLLIASLAIGYALPMVAMADAVTTGNDRELAPLLLAAAESERFNQLDVNQDGVIDRTEAMVDPDVAAAFDEIDTAGTGEITPEEFAAWEEVSEAEAN